MCGFLPFSSVLSPALLTTAFWRRLTACWEWRTCLEKLPQKDHAWCQGAACLWHLSRTWHKPRGSGWWSHGDWQWGVLGRELLASLSSQLRGTEPAGAGEEVDVIGLTWEPPTHMPSPTVDMWEMTVISHLCTIPGAPPPFCSRRYCGQWLAAFSRGKDLGWGSQVQKGQRLLV